MQPALTLAIIAIAAAPMFADETAIDFNRDVRPILSENCFHCHGPDEGRRSAELRLDREATAHEWAIVPGEQDDSAVWLRVSSKDPDEVMPPPTSNRSLTAKQRETIRRWIEQGAKYDEHWAFRTPVKPPVPEVQASEELSNLDRFVRARLQAERLAPAKRADRETLIRRVTFDLTGLPPTLEEIDAFVSDLAPNAWEKVVDRLLASDAYGERMTSEWLDVARYSDTYGYQVDRDRHVWPYRDWVLKAFNENLPYDRFLIEQVAGDLLPNATRDQKLATTFNRLHPQKVEGGSTPEEFRVEYVADRTQTFSTAFLGLTMECCRCHTHKYDPIPHTDYYSLFAFFDNIDEAGLYSFFTPSTPTPTLTLPSETQEQELKRLRTAESEAEGKLAAVMAQGEKSFRDWLRTSPEAQIPGELLHLDFEGKVSGRNTSVSGKVGNAIRLTGDDAVGTKVGNFRRWEPFSVSLWMKTPDVKERAVVFHRSRAWTDAGSRGYQLLIEEGQLSFSLIHFWPGNAIRIRTVEQLPVGEWTHVTCASDGSGTADGLQILVNGKAVESTIVRDHLTKQIAGGGGDHIAIGQRFRDRGFTRGEVDEFRVHNRQLSRLEVRQLIDGKSLSEALGKSGGEADNESLNLLREYWLLAVSQQAQVARDAVKSARQQRCQAEDKLTEIMVMEETDTPRQTYLLKRGAYDAPGQAVQPSTPSALPNWFKEPPKNRLDLARWATDPRHPLTSRVAVNRYWQMLFGDGLVRTPEDFGSQGAPPTHPKLLDWLAVSFVEEEWDLKWLLKTIVMSETYQQSSVHPESHRDPENRLLSRAPRYRLSAEMLRDNALAVSGLLVRKLGGPPAKPYELEASFKPIGKDKGDGLYRRSVYTYWKRTAPAPSMMTLDASKRDVCSVRRERTSSPLQAFVMLNGPQFVEASRVMAENLIEAEGDDQTAVLKIAFRKLTSRHASDAELTIIRRLYDQQLTRFTAEPKSTSEFLAVGVRKADPKLNAARLAATAAVINTLMNFDDCLLKH